MAKKHYFMGAATPTRAVRGVDPDRPLGTVTEGRARSGEESRQGVVETSPYLDGRQDVNVKPNPIKAGIKILEA